MRNYILPALLVACMLLLAVHGVFGQGQGMIYYGAKPVAASAAVPVLKYLNSYSTVVYGQDYANLVFTLPADSGYRAITLYSMTADWTGVTQDSVYLCNGTVMGTLVNSEDNGMGQNVNCYRFMHSSIPSSGSVTFRVKTSASATNISLVAFVHDGVHQTDYSLATLDDQGCGSTAISNTLGSTTMRWDGAGSSDCFVWSGVQLKPANADSPNAAYCDGIQGGSSKYPMAAYTGQTLRVNNITDGDNFYFAASTK